jgi:hypothetical protein
MTPGPILEELWRVKDELAREAGYDVARIFAELRAAEVQAPGPLIRFREELQRYVTEQERLHTSGLTLNEGP